MNVVKLLDVEEFRGHGRSGKPVRPRRHAASDLDINRRLQERPGGDRLKHPPAKALQVHAANPNRFQAASQTLEMLVHEPRPPLVEAQHLIHRVAEEKPPVERRNLDFAQRQLLTVQIGYRFHDSYLSMIGSRIVNFEPRPSSLCSSMVPPCASMMRRVVGRPRPLPPVFVE